MRLFLPAMCLILSANAFAEDISMIAGSSKIDNLSKNPKFQASVCLGTEAAGRLEPLANKSGKIGVMHALPNSTNDGRIYEFEKQDGQDRTFSFQTDEKGCLIISDTLVFGEFQALPETLRGHVTQQYDPISERIYGLVFDGLAPLTIVHIQHNRGIKSGRVEIETLK